MSRFFASADVELTAVFRVNASVDVGAGHLVRCMALARALEREGWSVAFAAAAESFGLLPLPGWPRLVIGGDPAAELDELRQRWPDGVDLLVVDHYGRDAAFESAARPWARALLAIDDLADRPHTADWIVDATPLRDPGVYNGLVVPQSRLLCGGAFGLLRTGFPRLRWRSKQDRSGDVQTILVSLGATDPGRHLNPVLDAVQASGYQGRIEVSLSPAAPHLNAVVAQLGRMNGVLLPGDTDMAEALARADLVIGAGGVSLLERCCLGLPSVIIPVAENQRANVAAIGSVGAALTLPASPSREALVSSLRHLLDDPAFRNALGRASARLCDGLGVYRVLLELDRLHSPTGRRMELRPAVAQDAGFMLAWQQMPGARRYARNPGVPTEAEHSAWFSDKLNDRNCIMSIIQAAGEPVGVVRLDWQPSREGFEVSILIDPARHGQGYGKIALALVRRLVPDEDIWAFVMPSNKPSLALFGASGYIPSVEPDWYVNRKLNG